MFILAEAPTTDMSFAPLFIKMVLASIAVIVLAFVALKYLLPYLTRVRHNSKSSIQILEHQLLSPRRSLYIVEIEGKKIALGATDQTITKICDL